MDDATAAPAAQPPPTRQGKPRVLCVDDEPRLLDGLKLVLRREYEVLTAKGGTEGIALFQSSQPIEVVLSDMRMPGMSGGAFLARIRELDPTSVRMLLTGHADIEAAASAVNEGQLFRFMTKPCPPATLLACFDAALAQRRLLLAERELLEKTLHGCVSALVEVLGLAQPAAFGKAMRLKSLVSRVDQRLGVKEWWSVEVAALLSQLGWIALPAELIDKLPQNGALSESERAMVDDLPSMARRLLANIPRLSAVEQILADCGSPFDRGAEGVPIGARISESRDRLRHSGEPQQGCRRCARRHAG